MFHQNQTTLFNLFHIYVLAILCFFFFNSISHYMGHEEEWNEIGKEHKALHDSSEVVIRAIRNKNKAETEKAFKRTTEIYGRTHALLEKCLNTIKKEETKNR